MNHEMREDEDGFVTKSILCMPIVNGQKTVIGVAQLINKARDPCLWLLGCMPSFPTEDTPTIYMCPTRTVVNLKK